MKKSARIFLILVLFFSVAIASYPPDIQNILNRKKIVVALVNRRSEPFFMNQADGSRFGFDIDLAKKIAKALGVNLEFLQTAKSFDEVVDQVNQGKVDIAISQLTINPRRAEQVFFTKPYISLYLAILMNRVANHNMITPNLKTVLNRMNEPTSAIGVLRGSSNVDYVKTNFPKAQIVPFDKTEQIFQAIVSGQIMFTLTDDREAEIWLHRNSQYSIKVQMFIDKDQRDPLGMAVSWDKPYLLDWLNIFIDIASSDGTLDRLKSYYVDGYDWMGSE